jgi:hypothetical protein
MKDYIMGTVLKVEDDTRRIVHQKFIWFNGGYWTNWFQEIDEVVALLLKQGFEFLRLSFKRQSQQTEFWLMLVLLIGIIHNERYLIRRLDTLYGMAYVQRSALCHEEILAASKIPLETHTRSFC